MIMTISITNNRIVNTTEPRIPPSVITEDSIVVGLTALKVNGIMKINKINNT